MNRKFLVVTGLFYFIATILGLVNVLNNNFSGISWVFVPLGIFIWGDALILGPFISLGSLWLLIKNKPVWTGLFFSSYVAARSFFEVIYAFNTQFSDSIRPWDVHWRNLEIVKSWNTTEIFVL